MTINTYKHSVWDNTYRAIREGRPNIYSKVAEEVANEINIPKSPVTLGHNDDRDAFRHAYISALTAYRYGPTVSEQMGNANEAKNNMPWADGNPPLEEWMDQENNPIGREIGLEIKSRGGSEQDLKILIQQALQTDKLITTPYDPRRTFNEHWNWDSAAQEAHDKILQDKKAEIDLITKAGRLNVEGLERIKRKYNFHQEKVNKIAISHNPDKTPSIHPAEIRTGPSYDPNPTTIYQEFKGPSNVNGEVFVHPYSRSTGEVRAHTRSSPDDSIGNNFGRNRQPEQGKAAPANYRAPSPNEKRLPGTVYVKKA